jgi:hypothetical protein
MASRHLNGFSDFPIADTHISTNACQGTGGVLPNLMKLKHQMRGFRTNLTVINALCVVHLLPNRPWYIVLFLAKFVI